MSKDLSVNSSETQTEKDWKRTLLKVILTVVFSAIGWFMIALVWALIFGDSTGALGIFTPLILGGSAVFVVKYSLKLSHRIVYRSQRKEA